MHPTMAAFARSWPWDPWLYVGLLIAAAIYSRGWLRLRRRDPERWPFVKWLAFQSGLLALLLALASPIEPFAHFLLQVHMLQHLLLMMVAAPLIWLGAPMLPMLRGMPRAIRNAWFMPWLRSHAVQGFFTKLTHPLVALPIYTAATWLWHMPPVYNAALRSPALHYAQHLSFLLASLVFWYPVVRPYPARPRWSPWLLLPYLLLADVQNTVLSALLTFSERVLYTYYNTAPRILDLSPLDDQAAAGVLMWVPGSVAFLGPLVYIGIGLMYGAGEKQKAATSHPSSRSLLPILAAGPPRPQFDLLRVPLLGDFLRWRYARRAVQTVLLLVAVLVIVDGFRGPQVGAMNLAGVLPWIHWRGLLVIGLLAAGNFFCFACPFTLPRAMLRKVLPTGLAWPHWLRSKWLAVALLILFLWSYEAFSLWDRPALTAWITLGYFAAATAIDSVFRDGSFCKYVCPIGQFNFVQSLLSPLSVGVKSHQACASCTTHDCLRGNIAQRGCDLQLFQPRKASNLDCTFCLDCVHACPHENVGILPALPASALWQDRPASGVGRLAHRPDLAVMVVVLVFGAFANAAGMVGPVVQWQDDVSKAWGQSSHLLTTSLFDSGCLLVLPLLTMTVATFASRSISKTSISSHELATRFAFSLVPLGFGMWLAHYTFHLFTSSAGIIPVTQRAAQDLGLMSLGDPLWSCACCLPQADWLVRLELTALGVGLVASLYAAWRIAQSLTSSSISAMKTAAPWTLLLTLLFIVGVWIVFQPMQMRGTLPGGG